MYARFKIQPSPHFVVYGISVLWLVALAQAEVRGDVDGRDGGDGGGETEGEGDVDGAGT